MLTIKNVDFQTIKCVWSKNLWLNRKSPIETHSAMKLFGGYDMEHFSKPAYFLAAYFNDRIVGCVSGHPTSSYLFRSRGLWVNESYRHQGIATALIDQLVVESKKHNCTAIWTVPRLTSLEFYKSVGFVQISDMFDEGVEYGPNCYAIKIIC
jgi:predicted GNAT family acetyltransferase